MGWGRGRCLVRCSSSHRRWDSYGANQFVGGVRDSGGVWGGNWHMWDVRGIGWNIHVELLMQSHEEVLLEDLWAVVPAGV